MGSQWRSIPPAIPRIMLATAITMAACAGAVILVATASRRGADASARWAGGVSSGLPSGAISTNDPANFVWDGLRETIGALVAPRPVEGPARPDDARITSLNRAARSWRRSVGPNRAIVDQVCIVRDVTSLLEAIALWDDHTFFPILFDDPSRTLPFLRAFRPSRIVYYQSQHTMNPTRTPRLPPDPKTTWQRATQAVSDAWRGGENGGPEASASDTAARPKGIAVPGIVFSAPDSPMLAGAIALAAGRFEPLVLLEPELWPISPALHPDRRRRFGDLIGLAEAWQFARGVEAQAKDVFPNAGELGDDCDFLTIAGDWPFRYLNEYGNEITRGIGALDDLIGRHWGGTLSATWLERATHRWAYTGRLIGGPSESLARAMSALFLQPSTALCWDTYTGGEPWSLYGMNEAADRLARLFPTPGAVERRSGTQADLADWHQVLDPLNRFGLFLVNSSGEPRHFAITGGSGRGGDIPSGYPSAVSMIHSFSAANPLDPQTIAGRWLEQGAFVYYGSVNEPYLAAFRRPQLIAELVARGIPMVAALRQGESEAYGIPWRLAYLGDPLYRIESGASSRPRLKVTEWLKQDPTYAAWPAVELPTEPGTAVESDNDAFVWCARAALAQFVNYPAGDSAASKSVSAAASSRPDWRQVLRQIHRERLPPARRSAYDEILIDTLRASGEISELSDRLARIPPGERGVRVWLAIESCAFMRLARAVRSQAGAEGFHQALTIWNEIIRMPWPQQEEFPAQLTERVASLAAAGGSRQVSAWREQVARAASDLSGQPKAFNHIAVVQAELRRVDSLAGRRN